MPDDDEEALHAAELAIFARRSLALHAAAGAGLPGRFEAFRIQELRVSMTTAGPYEFLNTVESVNDESVDDLADALRRFSHPHQVTIVAASPSQSLVERLLEEGYEPAPARPIAYLSADTPVRTEAVEGWRVREVTAPADPPQFLDLLAAGYAADSDVSALIRAEHAMPMVRGFIALRNGLPLAAAAMTLHPTGAVLGGASTLHGARGNGAHVALLAHRLQIARTLNVPCATATAAPGSPSIRNLARSGFTVVQRTAWRHRHGFSGPSTVARFGWPRDERADGGEGFDGGRHISLGR